MLVVTLRIQILSTSSFTSPTWATRKSTRRSSGPACETKRWLADLSSAWHYGFHITEMNVGFGTVGVADFQFPVAGITCFPGPSDGAAYLPPCLGISSLKYSAITAVFTMGGLLGSTMSDRVVKLEGVAGGIAWTAWLNLAGAMCMAAAPHWLVLGLGRFISGVACGLAVCLVPPYLAQLARATPSLAARSGQIGTLNQLAIVLGIFSSQLAGMLLTGPVSV